MSKDVSVMTCYYSVNHIFAGGPESPIELLSGSPEIVEKLFNLEFMISPTAFFQINTLGAEVLYENIGTLAELKNDSVVIDVCCGTGTIGLCLSSKCAKIYGVEIVEEAVKNAKRNAERNSIRNADFIAGNIILLESVEIP